MSVTSSLSKNLLKIIYCLTLGIILFPIVVLIQQSFFLDSFSLEGLKNSFLTDYILNTCILLFCIGVGSILIAVPLAWLTSRYEFIASKHFSWALFLPMAMPSYIIAYTYTGFLDVYGPVQSWFRYLTELSYGEYEFFQIRSIEGAILIMSLVLYPYVYLTTRVYFLNQSIFIDHVSKSLGLKPLRTFCKVSLPMARPAIVAGVLLVLMETLGEYGSMQYFGIPTFTTGIIRAFHFEGNMQLASQLSLILLLFVLIIVVIERFSRQHLNYHVTARASLTTDYQKKKLAGWKGIFAFCLCFLPILLGFFIPVIQLAIWAIEFEFQSFSSLVKNSFLLAMIASVFIVCIAFCLIVIQRLHFSKKIVSQLYKLMMTGYALPGVMIALGLMIGIAWIDHRLNTFLSFFDINMGLLLSGSLFILIIAYTIRFLVVALSPLESGLSQITPTIDKVGKTLGADDKRLLKTIYFPLLQRGFLTALLMVFVDILKELPATLILRPFDFNTLAVKAYELASDEQLIAASYPSLMIVGIGLIPVYVLYKTIDQSKVYDRNG